MPSGRRANSWSEVGLAHRQRQAAQVLAIERHDIEGVELDRLVLLA
jgi:hypothetical protein